MLEALPVVDVDVGRVIIAGVATPLKCGLQFAVAIEGLEEGDDVAASHRFVQRRRNGMKSVGHRGLFHQRGVGSDVGYPESATGTPSIPESRRA